MAEMLISRSKAIVRKVAGLARVNSFLPIVKPNINSGNA